MPRNPYDSDAHPFDGPEEQIRYLDDLAAPAGEVYKRTIVTPTATDRSRWPTAWDVKQVKADFGDDLHREGSGEIEELRGKERRLSGDIREAMETLERWKRERAATDPAARPDPSLLQREAVELKRELQQAKRRRRAIQRALRETPEERRREPSTLRQYRQAFHRVLIDEGDDGTAWEGGSRNAAFEAVDGVRELSTGTTEQYVRRNAEHFGSGDEMPTLEELIEAARSWG